jgi:co-chaperonin GroES (HSP10)
MIRILGDRVLVLLPKAETEITTVSGLVLIKDPDAARVPSRGIVLQLGEKRGTVDLDRVRAAVRTWFTDESTRVFLATPVHRSLDETLGAALDQVLQQLQPAPFDVQVGACVIFSAGAGEEFRQDGLDYVVLREGEILGIVEPIEKEAA